MYEDCKIYGPYLRKSDGRLYVNLIYPYRRTTMSYPKYLMEKKLGKYIDDEIHHKDGNPLNNKWDNLEIIERCEHAKQDVRRLEPETFICPTCNNTIILEGLRLSNFKRNLRYRGNMRGPFCNRSCAGKYGRKVKMGG